MTSNLDSAFHQEILPELTLTKAQALALFRTILTHLATDFGQVLENDSELDQISQVHRFHTLLAKLGTEKLFLSLEDVEETKQSLDEACAIQAEMDEIVTTAWLMNLEQINEQIEEAEEAYLSDEDEEQDQ